MTPAKFHQSFAGVLFCYSLLELNVQIFLCFGFGDLDIFFSSDQFAKIVGLMIRFGALLRFSQMIAAFRINFEAAGQCLIMPIFDARVAPFFRNFCTFCIAAAQVQNTGIVI